MATSTTTAVYNDLQARTPMVDVRTGVLSGQVWQRFFQNLSVQLQNLQAVANNAFGTNVFTLADQPSLALSDAGYVGFVSDYAHLVYWTGTAWIFLDAPGGYPVPMFVTPGIGWAACDGSDVDILTIGATLTTTTVTTPNLNGSPAYVKSAASYSSTINAASGTTGSGTTGTGTTGTGTTGTGTTGNESDHTHEVSGTTSNDGIGAVESGTNINVLAADHPHDHTFDVTSGKGTAHHHSIPGLSIPGLSIPSLTVAGLGVGTLDLAHVGAPFYVRQ